MRRYVTSRSFGQLLREVYAEYRDYTVSASRADVRGRGGGGEHVTVAIGLVCSNAVIVASDSMITTGATAITTQKVFALERLHALWASAGASYTTEAVQRTLRQLEQDEALWCIH